MRSRVFFPLYLFLLSQVWQACSPSTAGIHHLNVEYKTNPIGIAVQQPRLGWQLTHKQRNVKQIAYRILVANNENELNKKHVGNVWDSGKVFSDQSIQIPYEGERLISAGMYYWKVMVWDNVTKDSAWSETGSWQMGLLDESDWLGAKWIALEELSEDKVDALPASDKKDTWYGNNQLPIFRKTFTIQKPVRRATWFISGLGHFEASINGRKIGDHFLDAGWVKYDKEALYVTFDVTNNLNSGDNAIGVMLGNGFYFIPPVKGRFRKQKVAFGYPKMISRLLVEYQDGSTDNLVSDESWKTRSGPITFSSLYGGEDYDARLSQKGWDEPGFDDDGWLKPIVVTGPPKINPQTTDPLKVFEQFEAKTIAPTPNGAWVYDLGQNASGIIELVVKGRQGDTVRIYPGELLKDGEVSQQATGAPYYFEYILNDEEEQRWQPRFTYYGFRYLQVQGGVPVGQHNPAGKPTIISLKGLHTRNSATTVGDFVSSDTLFNQIHTLIDWAIRSNMASVFTDCPHREKLGWLEEVHLMGPSLKFRYDIPNLARKSVNDMMNSQLENGLVPEIAPEYVNFTWGGDMFRDSPEWGSSSIIVPWYLYRWYGDEEILRKAYPMMQRYVAYLQTKAENHILRQGLGDWYDLGDDPPGVSQLTPMGVTGTAIYYYDLTILAKIAKKLGDLEAEKAYAARAIDVRKAFNDTFFDERTKQYATGSQTANAMAVYMKLVAPEHKEAVVNHIISDIRSRNNSFTSGDIGHRYLLRVLEKEGRSDIIFDMNSRDDVPGYGYQLAKGATALTESWQALPNVSNNHFMLGHLMEWFYSGLAGIRQSEDGVAFKEIEIFPNPVGDIRRAEASYESPYGLIRSAWEKDERRFKLSVTIPSNTTAKVYLPGSESSRVTESNKALGEAGIAAGNYKDERHVVEIGSGTYLFEVK
ncbi:glycoside hydrolase family 78 protein [Parapedobacter tibetensis]|uniref:glycoside hydrolase family 78 protein n=1 Tax=Parapedobacter tibetensis TaxID=2972951 RepID=UPI00214D5D88|nr:glycoside hydrolase family 78 protein [Parapedobacter tibetensis]